MIIRISQPNPEGAPWYNDRVGEEFEVVGFRRGVPCMFEVDTAELKELGAFTKDRAMVPECDVEVVEPESSWKAKYVKLLEEVEWEQVLDVAEDVAKEMRNPAKYAGDVLHELRQADEISEEQFERLLNEKKSVIPTVKSG